MSVRKIIIYFVVILQIANITVRCMTSRKVKIEISRTRLNEKIGEERHEHKKFETRNKIDVLYIVSNVINFEAAVFPISLISGFYLVGLTLKESLATIYSCANLFLAAYMFEVFSSSIRNYDNVTKLLIFVTCEVFFNFFIYVFFHPFFKSFLISIISGLTTLISESIVFFVKLLLNNYYFKKRSKKAYIAYRSTNLEKLCSFLLLQAICYIFRFSDSTDKMMNRCGGLLIAYFFSQFRFFLEFFHTMIFFFLIFQLLVGIILREPQAVAYTNKYGFCAGVILSGLLYNAHFFFSTMEDIEQNIKTENKYRIFPIILFKK